MALAGLGLAAGAEPAPDPSRDLASACQLDFQLFCQDVDPESHRDAVEACLEANRDVLTESCRAALDPALVPERPPGPGPVERACRAQFVRTCGRAPDRVAFARCIQIHRREFSPACRDALADEIGPPPRGSP